MEDQQPEVRFGMDAEAAQMLHEALGKALAANQTGAQAVTISMQRETVERLQAIQGQGMAHAVVFGIAPIDESAGTEQTGQADQDGK